MSGDDIQDQLAKLPLLRHRGLRCPMRVAWSSPWAAS